MMAVLELQTMDTVPNGTHVLKFGKSGSIMLSIVLMGGIVQHVALFLPSNWTVPLTGAPAV